MKERLPSFTESIPPRAEAKMNGFPEAATGDRFEGDEYRFLIVASKFQTGFDQPKRVAMVVDKKLSGVACVQTPLA